MTKTCVVFLCDNAYFYKFINTCYELLTVGNYKGEICLVIGDDLNNEKYFGLDNMQSAKIPWSSLTK